MPDEPSTPTEPPKQPVGRPLKYKTVEELQSAVDAYFNECDPHLAKRMVEVGTKNDGEPMFGLRDVMTDQRPYTMSGLAHALKISRQTLLDYGEREEFLDTLGDAKERVHRFTEEQLFSKSATGAVFSLKNNWGWKDRQELTGAEGAPLMPIGLDSAILARMKDRGETPPVTAEDSGE